MTPTLPCSHCLRRPRADALHCAEFRERFEREERELDEAARESTTVVVEVGGG